MKLLALCLPILGGCLPDIWCDEHTQECYCEQHATEPSCQQPPGQPTMPVPDICAGLGIETANVLATGQVAITIATDADNVFVAWEAGISVFPKPSGAPRVLIEREFPSGMITDETNIYWSSFGPAPDYQGSVSVMPKTGGAPVRLAQQLHLPHDLAIDATNLYWIDEGTEQANGQVLLDGAVMTMPKAGGPVRVLAAAQQRPIHLAIDAKNVYWTTWNDGAVMMVPKTGGTPVTLDRSGKIERRAVISDGADVFFTGGAAGGLVRRPVAGGAATLVSKDVGEAFAIDGELVYFTGACPTGSGWGLATLARIPKTGGAVTTLVSDLARPKPLAFDDGHLYASSSPPNNNNETLMLAK